MNTREGTEAMLAAALERIRRLEQREQERTVEAQRALPAGALRDAAVLATLAEIVGESAEAIASRRRVGGTAQARAVVAGIMRRRLGWTVARIARSLGATERGVRKMLTSSGFSAGTSKTAN